MGCCARSCTYLVLLVAIIVGMLFAGIPQQAGLFRYIDDLPDSNGNQFQRGMTPLLHEGTPWGFTEDDMPDLTGQHFIVTGANVGLGYWTAFHLAKAGGTVTMACRKLSKCEDARSTLGELSINVNLLKCAILDLGSFASVRDFSKLYKEEQNRLDSLVLNAGIMVPPFQTTVDGLESQIGVNHFGHFLLTQELLPLLQDTAASSSGVATIVSVSSAAHFDSYPEGIKLSIDALNDEASYNRVKAYGQSKLANVLFAQELSERVSESNILVNAIHPGGVDTDLMRHALDVMESYAGRAVANWIKTSVISSMIWTPRDAALTQVYAAVGLKDSKITGKYFHPIARLNKPCAVHATNATLQKSLWEMTQAFVDTH